MAHFFEVIKNSRISFDVELAKIQNLVSSEVRYYWSEWGTLLNYLNEKVFRDLPLSNNYTNLHLYISDLFKSAKDSSERFIFYCEFVLSLFEQSANRMKHTYAGSNMEKTINETVKIIDVDLKKLNLVRKMIADDELGHVWLIVPNNATLEKALTKVDESNIQDYLIEYCSSHNDGNVGRKEELLILIQKYIEGITKNRAYKESNERLFDNVDMLFNNLDLRHNKDVNDPRYYEETKSNREHWLDMLYDLSLMVINSKEEYEHNKEIKDLKRKVSGK